MAERKKASLALTSKTCKDISDLVLAYLSDKLSPKAKKDFECHIKSCPDCVSFLNTYKKTVNLTGAIDPRQMPARVRNNILAFLRKRTRRVD